MGIMEKKMDTTSTGYIYGVYDTPGPRRLRSYLPMDDRKVSRSGTEGLGFRGLGV